MSCETDHSGQAPTAVHGNGPTSRIAMIRELNDALRKSFVGGAVMITPGVAALPDDDRAELLAAVREFDLFDYDNDPHGEHDLGIVDLGSGRFLWKIDYFDKAMTFASPDPADPTVTQRVMTVMRADEY